jgi:hypothetical protein
VRTGMTLIIGFKPNAKFWRVRKNREAQNARLPITIKIMKALLTLFTTNDSFSLAYL